MPQTFNVGSRSLFVTVTAWVFIVLAALASVSALLQNAAMASFLPGLTVVGNVQPLPLLTGLLMGYLPWVVGAGLAGVAGHAGLRRRPAAAPGMGAPHLHRAAGAGHRGQRRRASGCSRRCCNRWSAARWQRSPLPPLVADVFGGFVTAARVMAVLVTVGACLLLVWIIRRLMSPSVRQEFA